MSRVQIPYAVETKYTLTSAAGGLASGTVVTGPVSGASVSVTLRSDGTPATVYAAETGSGTLSGGALVTDANGNIPGWVTADVQYNITIGSIGTYAGAGPIGFDAVSGLGFPADQAANVGSPRTLGAGALQAMAGNDVRVATGLNVKAYGALGDGSTDDTTAILAAIAALPVTGGRLFFPSGLYVLSGQLIFDNLRSVKINGVAGLSAGAQPASMLRFTQAGSSSAISARSTFGFVAEDLAITTNNAGFTGSLVDLSHGSSLLDSAYADLSRCLLSAPTTTGSLLLLDRAIACTFHNVYFNGASVGVLGRSSSGNYSNSHSFVGCTFASSLNTAVRNPGQGWGFLGCTFENLSGGGAGALLCDPTYVAHGVSFTGGCWFGDAGVSGDWINYQGSGLTVVGCYIGAGNVGVRLPTNIQGVVITGNQFDQTNSNAVIITSGGKNVVVLGNDMSTVVGIPVAYAGGTMPIGSIIQNDGQNGVFVTGGVLLVSGPVSDTNFPVPPPNGTDGFDQTNKQHYVKAGGAWHASPAYS